MDPMGYIFTYSKTVLKRGWTSGVWGKRLKSHLMSGALEFAQKTPSQNETEKLSCLDIKDTYMQMRCIYMKIIDT